MKIKSGFYLSPDGLHVVEIENKCNSHFHTFIINFSDSNFVINGSDHIFKELEVLFSAWSILE